MAVGRVDQEVTRLAPKRLANPAQMVKLDPLSTSLIITKHCGLADSSLLGKPVPRFAGALQRVLQSKLDHGGNYSKL